MSLGLPSSMFRFPRLLIKLTLMATIASTAHSEDPPFAGDPADVYLKTVYQAQSAYRKALAESLLKATKIEVYLLDFEVKDLEDQNVSARKDDSPKEQFPIGPYKSETSILKRRVLTAAEIKKLMPPLQSTIGVEKNTVGSLCHFPIHGMRVWAGDQLILQTSFCWMCSNFSLQYPDLTDRWVGIKGNALKKVMTELMPIPASEIQRFKKQYEGAKTDLNAD
jgi:hypothetical protein